MDLLRGPLLHTPHGWVVLGSAVLYVGLAVVVAVSGAAPPVLKTPGAFYVLCFAWPFILFLYFVRVNSPSFAASSARALVLASVAIAPFIYTAWRSYG